MQGRRGAANGDMALEYQAYNWVGRKVQGVLPTDSQDVAYAMLREQGLTPYSMKQRRARRSFVDRYPGLFKPKARELVEFTNEISSLLSSGIPLREALGIAHRGASSVGFRHALGKVIQEIESGHRFSEACATAPTVFPERFVRVIRVAESTGNLTQTIQALSIALEREYEAGQKIRRALTYPAIALVVAFVGGVILMTYALPSLLNVVERIGTGSQLPLTTRVLINFRSFLVSYGNITVAGVLGLTAILFFAGRSRSGRRLADRILLQLPVVGKALIAKNTFSVTSTLSTLIENGVAPLEAIQLSAEGVTNTVIRDALTRVAQAISSGKRMSVAFSEQGDVFPSLLPQAVAIGERAGNLRDGLRGLATYYERETEKTLGNMTDLIQPLIILVVGGLIGFVSVGVVSGIYSSIGSITK